jgi:3-oxoacyl-(acyl-carrier-protein) synthase
LKILNAGFPAPYADRPTGSIGLGDGAAFAVLAPGRGDFVISAQSLHNEMQHFTANRADGAGFATCLAPLQQETAGRRLWLKGHGTGTLEAGRLESAALAGAFPGAPLVAWKGSLGHTLGSCGLVELALACESIRTGRAPGTLGSVAPAFEACVAFESIATGASDAVVCASNAFGGAHAAFLLTHA